ncbi:uncharacterized protein LOC142657130 [Rhinoderma darwinii]|uniref:uncharacterized protein LOC142657130 n=1 Tax=Rhinoderma darwinii TaxID=43563 RepID=UPI003F66758F
MMKDLSELFCMGEEGQSTNNGDTQEKFISGMTNFLGNTQCRGKSPVGNISPAETAQELYDLLKLCLEPLGLLETVIGLLCTLTSPVSQSECLGQLNENIPDTEVKNILDPKVKNILSSLETLSCETRKFKLDLKTVTTALDNLMCTVFKEIEIKALEGSPKTVQELINNALKKFINHLLNNINVNKTLKTVVCAVDKVVNKVLG